MRSSASELLPIFRSRLQGELLAAVLLDRAERSVTELAGLLAAPVATVQREVARLERAGILASRRIGRTRLVSADRGSPISEPLVELVLRTFGPAVVLSRELDAVAGVERADIFGSWAARYHGERGAPPGDIDVVVVGTPDRDDLFDAAARAGRQLGREVNTVVVSRQRWDDNDEAFLRGIRARPTVTVIDNLIERSERELGTRPRRHSATAGGGPARARTGRREARAPDSRRRGHPPRHR